MDKFEEEEMKEINPVQNTFFDRLIYYIPECIPIFQNLGRFKDKVINLFKTNTPKQTVY